MMIRFIFLRINFWRKKCFDKLYIRCNGVWLTYLQDIVLRLQNWIRNVIDDDKKNCFNVVLEKIELFKNLEAIS